MGALELGEELEWAIGLPPLNCDVGGVEREIAGCHGGNEGGVLWTWAGDGSGGEERKERVG